MQIRIAIDINMDLIPLEDVARQYQEQCDRFVFTANERYPIINIEKLKSTEDLRTSPYLPYMCVPCVVSLLLYNIYDDTIMTPTLFRRNPYVNSNVNFYDEYLLNMEPEEIVKEYMPNMPDAEAAKFVSDAEMLYKKYVKSYVSKYLDHVFKINHESKLLIIEILGDIKELRFDELADKLPLKEDKDGVYLWNNNTELNEELKRAR